MFTETDIHDYQHRLIDRSLDRKRNLWIVPMGGGKTLCSGTVGKELMDEGLIDTIWVFAPKRVGRGVWPVDLTIWQHLQHLTVAVVMGTPAQREKALASDAQVKVINFDNLPWLKARLKKKRLPARTMVIIDELGKLRNATGKQAKAAEYLMKNVEYRIGMTGTPKPKGHLGLFMQARLIHGEELWEGAYTHWRADNFETVDYDGHQWEPREGHAELLENQFATVCDIVTEEEMGAANVEPNIDPIMLEIPKPALAAHDVALKKWMLSLPEHRIKELLANAAVGSGKARQIASGFVYDENGASRQVHTAKLDLLAEKLEEANEPAVICYGYQPELDALRRLLPNALSISGDVTDREADRAEAMWKAGDLEHLLIHPASAGHGLNLQSGGRFMFWFTLPWDLEQFRQTNKRLARQGQTKPVWVHPLIAHGTVEETLVWPRLLQRGDEEDRLKALIHAYQQAA